MLVAIGCIPFGLLDINCIYRSYANGLCSYVTEVAARTEQHWCPIKHARRLRNVTAPRPDATAK